MPSRLLALLLAVLLVAGCGAPDARDSSATTVRPDSHADPGLASGLVHTAGGAVRGVVAPDHLLFQGIPYAAAPVGPLRWQAPQPAPAWAGERDARQPGTRCVQNTVRDPDWGRKAGEDCLSVTVWAPRTPPMGSGRAVMVWFHGGGFANGSADIYDSRALATRGDIVVVTVNYRLGAPGFLAHPALEPAGETGNYGLLDQQAALRWVRDNIGAFGGDAAKVTIAGQSAGGMAVCDHLVAPGSAGLFRAAIIVSAPCTAQAQVASAQRDSIAYANARGCTAPSAARCLRALPESRLADPPWFFHIGTNTLSGPVIGPPVLPVDPAVAISAGNASPVPLLIGTTHDEFTLFMALQYLRRRWVPAAGDYPGMLAEVFGPDAAAVAVRYRLEDFGGEVVPAYSAAITDAYFSCVADRIGRGQTQAAPVYSYEFNDPHAPSPEPFRHLPFPIGASHGLDLRYLFAIAGAPPLDATQQRLSDQMIGYWTAFVKTGVPGFTGAPAWPTRNDGDAHYMAFEPAGSRVIDTFGRDHQCDFWSSLTH